MVLLWYCVGVLSCMICSTCHMFHKSTYVSLITFLRSLPCGGTVPSTQRKQTLQEESYRQLPLLLLTTAAAKKTDKKLAKHNNGEGGRGKGTSSKIASSSDQQECRRTTADDTRCTVE
eukprot:scpid5673/ scgid33635/ 